MDLQSSNREQSTKFDVKGHVKILTSDYNEHFL